MPNYVDVYVMAVPTENLDAYRRLAETAAKVWREHGALQYVEVVGDDVPSGVHTSFEQAVLLQPGETVVVGWAVFTSRQERDRINAAVMADPRIANVEPKSMPFDGKRMFWGGFGPLVEA